MRSKTDVFSLLSLNCQSIQAKFDLLKAHLHSLHLSGCEFDVICLQETWLTHHHNLSLLQLEGYKLVTGLPSCSLHGGVGLYIKANFEYKILNFVNSSAVWDGQFIEILNNSKNITASTGSGKKLVIGNIYRPPRDNVENIHNFIQDLNNNLNRLQNMNCEVTVVGDFNLDLLKVNDKPLIHDYLETVLSNGFIPKITFPTRISRQSCTLIDNAFVKISNDYSQTTAGILTHCISDHQPYYVTLDYLNYNRTEHRFIKVFSNDNRSLQNFKNEIADMNLINELDARSEANPCENYEILHRSITEAINKHLPIQIVKYNKHKHKRNKWITSGILNSIKFRDRLYTRLHRTPIDSTEYDNMKINLQTYNRLLKQNIRNAKKLYYNQYFSTFKNDIKKPGI